MKATAVSSKVCTLAKGALEAGVDEDDLSGKGTKHEQERVRMQVQKVRGHFYMFPVRGLKCMLCVYTMGQVPCKLLHRRRLRGGPRS